MSIHHLCLSTGITSCSPAYSAGDLSSDKPEGRPHVGSTPRAHFSPVLPVSPHRSELEDVARNFICTSGSLSVSRWPLNQCHT